MSLTTIGLVAKPYLNHKGLTTLQRINTFLRQQKKTIIYNESAGTFLKNFGTPLDKLIQQVDFIVALGGDGTLIQLAEYVDYRPVPILSINLGTVGLLTEVQKPSDSIEALKKILKGKYQLDERSLLRASIYRKGGKIKSFLAVNEVVVNHGSFARIVDFSIYMGGRRVISFKADGVIFATPTGSTGHSLSAGGSIIHPKLAALTITPICPVKRSIQPIILPDDREFMLSIDTQRKDKEEAIGFTADGQRGCQLHYGDQIKIRRSGRSLYLARLNTKKYYKILRDLLAWGE